ncbi:MAG: hypothetical protein RIQ56_260 [Candidatus Parcubacteria bacterium]
MNIRFFLALLLLTVTFTTVLSLGIGQKYTNANCSDPYHVRIGEMGGREAYERLALCISQMSEEDQHTEAHQFGDALYSAEGFMAATICDAEYS